jgi:DNA-binding transcriptional regulator YdaS (Cro superfamily)
MSRMTKAAALAALVAVSGPALAQSEKDRTCEIQGNLMAAIQQARLQGVSQEKLAPTIKARNPGLTPAVVETIPALGQHVYAIELAELRKVKLGAVTRAQCLANWDQIQAMAKKAKK